MNTIDKSAHCILFVCILFPSVSSEPSLPKLERPTLKCLGVHWLVKGPNSQRARIQFNYRKNGEEEWQRGLDLFRIETAAIKGQKPPAGSTLYAGSIFNLEEDTEYELELTLRLPNRKPLVHSMVSRTRAEPKAFEGGRKLHVVPGNGGGRGTRQEPFQGLAAADKAAKPGDIILIHKGDYIGLATFKSSGVPGKPIVWRGGIDGEVILDGTGDAEKMSSRTITASNIHDVHFEGLTVRRGKFLIVCHRSKRIVLRYCHLKECDYGFTCTNNAGGRITNDFYIADNVIEGPSAWPRTKGIESARGIQVTGNGHAICFNRIRGFADAIDTFTGPECAAIDIYNNEISEMTDDGIEMDYSQRNTRCFNNRLTNVFQGISTQPVHGGPVYIFRNAMLNVVASTFKMNNSPSGALMIHNTAVKKGMALVQFSGATVRNTFYRNNLFIGTAGNYAYENTSPMKNCDFDYDGFGGGPFKLFMKWNGVRYKSIKDLRSKCPVYRNCISVEAAGCFANGLRAPQDAKQRFATDSNDLQLHADSGAVDRGVILNGINDDFTGKAPDLGAYEFGKPIPHYGPRPRE